MERQWTFALWFNRPLHFGSLVVRRRLSPSVWVHVHWCCPIGVPLALNRISILPTDTFSCHNCHLTWNLKDEHCSILNRLSMLIRWHRCSRSIYSKCEFIHLIWPVADAEACDHGDKPLSTTFQIRFSFQQLPTLQCQVAKYALLNDASPMRSKSKLPVFFLFIPQLIPESYHTESKHSRFSAHQASLFALYPFPVAPS